MATEYKKIKPLVIGIGVAGRWHMNAQLNLGIKTGVYTTNPKKIKVLRQNENITIFDDLEKGIDWSNLVHVCTPDDQHTQFVAMALKKGRAVFCEKAFTTSLKDALVLQNLAHKFKATLIIAQNYRLTPSFLETKKIIQSGVLGKIIKIESNYLHDKDKYQERKPLRKNKDFLYIVGSHAVDLACWVTGENVSEVKATSKNELNYKATLKFLSGTLGEIKLDATKPLSISGINLKVVGEKATIVSHNKINELLFYKKGSKKPKIINLPNKETLTIGKEVKIIDNYLTGKSSSYYPLPDVDQAVQTIRILDAVEKSIFSKKSERI